MLSVPYSPDVPAQLVQLLEHHARRHGLSLEALEVIGASLDFVEMFIVASEDERVPEFLERAGLAAPQDKVSLARWQAERLFGAKA